MIVSSRQIGLLTIIAEENFLAECERFFRDEMEEEWLTYKTDNLTAYLKERYNEAKDLELEEKFLILKYMIACLLVDEKDEDDEANLNEMIDELAEAEDSTEAEEILSNFLEDYIED